MLESAAHMLNHASADAARAALTNCCAAHRWVDRMLTARPFASAEALQTLADAAFANLERADWLEAFAHHPKIGDAASLRKQFAATATWAAGEQSGVNAATEEMIQALAAGNAAYAAKFGFIFIICATGKSAAEMLAALHARLGNTPERELPIAAAEQRKITHLRLAKLGA